MAMMLGMVAALEPGMLLGGGKRRLMNLYWKLRAEIRRQVGKGKERKQSFHYDSFSYSLNFDDGCCGFLSL